MWLFLGVGLPNAHGETHCHLVKFEKSLGVCNTTDAVIVLKSEVKEEKETHMLTKEGFLLDTYRPMIDALNQVEVPTTVR